MQLAIALWRPTPKTQRPDLTFTLLAPVFCSFLRCICLVVDHLLKLELCLVFSLLRRLESLDHLLLFFLELLHLADDPVEFLLILYFLLLLFKLDVQMNLTSLPLSRFCATAPLRQDVIDEVLLFLQLHLLLL